MSLRLEMLQVARLAPRLLGDSAELVRAFLFQQQNPDGGFKDRAGASDLYYTVFGLDGLLALGPNISSPELSALVHRAGQYVGSFSNGEELDFVHLCCLARVSAALSNLGGALPGVESEKVLGRIEKYRSNDGGYHPTAGRGFGTAYGAFLALGAHQDLKRQLPEPLRLVQALKTLETPDGAWTNEPSRHPIGATNATAAAATLLRNLDMPVSAAVGDWLLARAHSQGGFLATPTAPAPDLLSTATALHALAGLQVSFEGVKEECLDFIDSLWTNEGGFYGHWHDDSLDSEYTFYGLLALGHLSL